MGLHDVELIKCGRNFLLPCGRRLVVGRIHGVNLKLQELAREEDFLLRVKGVPGPTGLTAAHISEQEVQLAADIVAAYSDAETGEEAIVVVSGKDDREITITVRPKEEFRELLI